jgi:3-deoxy-D-manno-octulosonate 8-phosphate phosphatase (KDO 8-P phosphatase)
MPSYSPELVSRASKIRLLISDVDGCWTDGRIFVDADGRESVSFDVHDGYGMQRLQEAGIEIAVISGRQNPAVAARAKKLGLDHVHLGQMHKAKLAKQLVAERQLSANQVAAFGDDLPDLDLFAAAGLRIAPSNAVAEIRAQADWITQACGGRGAMRELCDLLVAAVEPDHEDL